MEIVTTSWVLNGSAPPLRSGAVAVESGRIAWTGPVSDRSRPQGRVRDLGPGVLMPGLVNAHCHLELSDLVGQVDATRGYVPWVESLVGARARRPDTAGLPAAVLAIHALEASGTVAVGDVSNGLVHLDALRGSPLRAVVSLELLAWDPARAEAAMATAEEQLSAEGEGGPGLELRLGAHAPHSVSGELFRRLVARGGPAMLHLAESGDELRFLRSGDGEWAEFLRRRGLGHVAFTPPGVSPVAYAHQFGALHPRLVAAHCVQTDEADWRVLAWRGVSVAVCPRSNRAMGVGQVPIDSMRQAGVRLCLGTDSLASVPTLDLLDDMRELRRLGLEPGVIAEMATRGGAMALGLSDLGTLEVGKTAAMAFAAAVGEPAEPFEFLFDDETRLRTVAV